MSASLDRQSEKEATKKQTLQDVTNTPRVSNKRKRKFVSKTDALCSRKKT